MKIELPELPYQTDALTPFLSKETMETHYGKHHRGYIKKLNRQIEDTAYADLSLHEIVVQAHAKGDSGVFNNAAQAWNHGFLWESMTPDGGGNPAGLLDDSISAAFGDLEGFSEAFRDAAKKQFGSGWVWLVADAEGLQVTATGNADTPIATGQQPLLTLDVWEHAYYLDYKNERGRYVDTFLEKYVNWSFAAANHEAAAIAA